MLSSVRHKHVLRRALHLFCKLDQSNGSIYLYKTERSLMRHITFKHRQTNSNRQILPGGKLGFSSIQNVRFQIMSTGHNVFYRGGFLKL